VHYALSADRSRSDDYRVAHCCRRRASCRRRRRIDRLTESRAPRNGSETDAAELLSVKVPAHTPAYARRRDKFAICPSVRHTSITAEQIYSSRMNRWRLRRSIDRATPQRVNAAFVRLDCESADAIPRTRGRNIKE